MRINFGCFMRMAASATLIVLGACSQAGGTASGVVIPAAKTATVTNARVATFVLSLSGPLTIGTPASIVLSCVAYDAHGNVITGTYRPAVMVVDNDKSGQTSLSGKSITSSTQTLTLTYRGKGDTFTIRGSAGLTSHIYRIITTLPQEVPLATPTPGTQTMPTTLRFGPDGNLWSVVNGQNISRDNITVARITPSGQVTLLSDPNSNHWYSDWTKETIAAGSDGAMWFPYGTGGSGQGLDRVDTGGNFTSFPLPNTVGDAVTSVAAGPGAPIWFATSNSVGGQHYAIAQMQANGTVNVLAGSLPNPPYNLVLGPDGNMWFAMGDQVAKITTSGKVSTYTLPIVPFGNWPVLFAVGPDGNFWAPFPAGDNELVKFNTSGNVVSVKKYSGPKGPQITDIAADASGVWLTDWNYGVIRVARDGTATEYPTYTPNALPESLTTGPDKRVYFADTITSGLQNYVGGLGSVAESNW